MLSFDIETTGLNPHKDSIKLAQFYDPDTNIVEMIPNPTLDQIHKRLSEADVIVGHNLAFDFGFCKFIPNSIDQFEDTLYLSRIEYFDAESHTLDSVAKRVIGVDPYKGLDKKTLQKSDWSKPLTPEQRRYAEIDVQIIPTLVKLMHAANNKVYRFDKRSIIAGLKMQSYGLPILQSAARVELGKQRHLRDSLLAQLSFNPNSPKQAKEALNIETTGDKFLAEAASKGNQLAQVVRDARSAIKYINFLEKLSSAPRYFGTLSPSARSGRFTSNNENLQNLPRDTKRFIGFAAEQKMVIISADFSALELRSVAALTQDATMLRLFKEDADLHGYIAMSMFGTDYTKQQRQIAKTFNFSLLYGSGAATVRSMLLSQTGIDLPESEVQVLKQKWLSEFSGIAKWQRIGSSRHQAGKPWQTPEGRQYTSKRFTDHLSIENQGFSAAIARLALHKMLDTLPSQAHVVDFIHDAYVVECPNDPAIYIPAAKAIHAAMQHGWAAHPAPKHGLEMPVEVGVAFNFKDSDSLENCLYIFKGD